MFKIGLQDLFPWIKREIMAENQTKKRLNRSTWSFMCLHFPSGLKDKRHKIVAAMRRDSFHCNNNCARTSWGSMWIIITSVLVLMPWSPHKERWMKIINHHHQWEAYYDYMIVQLTRWWDGNIYFRTNISSLKFSFPAWQPPTRPVCACRQFNPRESGVLTDSATVIIWYECTIGIIIVNLTWMCGRHRYHLKL